MKTLPYLVALLILAVSANAQTDYEGVLSLRPAGENTCVAIEIPTPPGSPITGLRWIHNDSEHTFPRLVLMEGEPGIPPDLTQTSLTLLDLSSSSLQWGEVDFGGPVTSSTEMAYAVFYFPAGEETVHVGQGGGPGLGIRESANATPFYLTGDGVHWATYAPTHELSVEAVRGGLMKGAQEVRILSEMESEVLDANTGAPPLPARTALLAPAPNPFNPRVTLSYTLAKPGPVELSVYDIKGRLVSTLVSSQKSAGRHSIVWQGTDLNGRAVASGVYFARLVADGVEQSYRMALVR